MNFEAVGPERLVLVARDPWIAHHVSDEILSPRSIEKDHPPDDLCASRFAHPAAKNCRLRRPWPSQSRSMNFIAITSPPQSGAVGPTGPHVHGCRQPHCPLCATEPSYAPSLPCGATARFISPTIRPFNTERPREELAETLAPGISATTPNKGKKRAAAKISFHRLGNS